MNGSVIREMWFVCVRSLANHRPEREREDNRLFFLCYVVSELVVWREEAGKPLTQDWL